MRLTRRGLAIGVAAVVVLGGAATGITLALGGSSKASAGTTSTATVKRGTLTVTASAAGTVQPYDERALIFGTNGTVATLSVKVGQQVSAGQILATLDATDAQNAVDSASQALEAAQSNLDLAEEQAATPTPSTTTTTCTNTAAYMGGGYSVVPAGFVQGDTGPTPTPTTTPTATPTPTPTPKPTTTRTATPPSTTNTSRCGTGAGGSGTGGSGGAGGSGFTGSGGGQSSGDSLLRAQQSVNNDELALEQAQQKLAGTTITAPVAGRVLSISGSVGSTVSAGGSGFIVLGGVNSLGVEASFSEVDVAPITIGQQATVTLADHADTPYKATVAVIDPAGTTSGDLVKYGVRLDFTDPPADLLIGQTADVAVITSSIPDALYVPTAAVTSGPDGTYQVLVRTPTGDQARTVTVGIDADQGTQITSGLNEGDTVVIR